ncbi:hypothetical protein KKF84_02070 [Myxococcota bacterium]|nr:hypothetical protein [Myxococcota bacterium]
MPGIGIISNANARLNKMSPKLKDSLNFILGRRGDVVSTYTLDDVTQAVSEFKRYEVDIIAISGGDGTAHRTLEKLISGYGGDPLPPILLLPSGTQNMVPKSFGITGNSISTMILTQTRYMHNLPLTTVKRNLLRVNGHYSFMFGLGISTRFLEAHYARGTSHWHAMTLLGSYMVDALKGGDTAMRLTAPIPMDISINGQQPVHEDKIHTVFCSFAEELALRFRCFPRAGWQEGMFESLLLDAGMTQTVRAMPFLWAGSLKELPGIRRNLLKTMDIELQSPECYTLDGEIYPAVTSLHLESGPELEFIIPRLTPLDRAKKIRSRKIGPWGRSFYV